MTDMTVDNLKQLHRDDFCRFESSLTENPEELSSFLYGNLRLITGEVQDTDYYLPELCSGSDYCGNALQVSNHRLFFEQFGEVAGVHNVYSGYGTFAIAVLVSAITPEMLEVFAGLEDYPAIDDEDMSRVEFDAEIEAWDSWAKHDFIRLLADKFPDLEEKIEALENREDDNTLLHFFEEMRERTNQYWENEEGNSAWIRLEKIVEGITKKDIPTLKQTKRR